MGPSPSPAGESWTPRAWDGMEGIAVASGAGGGKCSQQGAPAPTALGI